MCNQCPTVGEFICSILRAGSCHNTCKASRTDRCERKCERCEREEKRYECFRQEKKEHARCERPEKEHDKSDCCCKFY